MKKIFKKLFSVDRIELISKHFNLEDSSILEIGVHRGDFSKELFEYSYTFPYAPLLINLDLHIGVFS